MDPVLVVSAESSSLRFSVFHSGATHAHVSGVLEGIARRPELVVNSADPGSTTRLHVPHILNHALAIQFIGEWLRAQHEITPVAVGHQIIHGGAEFDRPAVISANVLERLGQFEVLAPHKQPHSISVIRNVMVRFPDLPQVACFETSFHRTHGPLADWYALPRALHEAGVRRYGFHGLSYESVVQQLRRTDPLVASGKTIVVRLDGESSMCALHEGRSVESTLGFSTLGGLPMRTRPGELDPGVVLYLINQKRMAPSQVERLLYEESGLKGLSGLSGDVDELNGSSDPAAGFAIDYLIYKIAMAAGALVSALGGLDGFVFTGKTGVSDPLTRRRVVDRLHWLGLRLSDEDNGRGDRIVSKAASAAKIFVIPSNEELAVAEHTYDALARLKTRQSGKGSA